MPHEPLSPDELTALRRFSTPSIANAIERFNVRPRHHGFTGPDIHCMFPAMPPVVGYASTAIVMAEQPPPGTREAGGGRAPPAGAYWDCILSIPRPRLAVVRD